MLKLAGTDDDRFVYVFVTNPFRTGDYAWSGYVFQVGETMSDVVEVLGPKHGPDFVIVVNGREVASENWATTKIRHGDVIDLVGGPPNGKEADQAAGDSQRPALR